jgi:hypothetical protein
MTLRLSLWLVPTAMLVAALAPWPYSYYLLLRLVVCVCCCVIAYQSHERHGVTPWVIGLAVVAVVFNPFVPIHLTRAIWSVLNAATAVFLVAHMFTEAKK